MKEAGIEWLVIGIIAKGLKQYLLKGRPFVRLVGVPAGLRVPLEQQQPVRGQKALQQHRRLAAGLPGSICWVKQTSLVLFG